MANLQGLGAGFLFGFSSLLAVAQPGDQGLDKKRPAFAEGAVASPEKLRDLIAGLGYEEGLKLEGGTVKFAVTVDKHRFEFLCELSKDEERSRIWLWTGLKHLTDKELPPAGMLLRLLADNEQDHRFFSVNAASGLVQLNSSAPNVRISPGKLQRELEGFKNRIRKTEDLWNPAKWPAAAPAKPPQ